MKIIINSCLSVAYFKRNVYFNIVLFEDSNTSQRQFMYLCKDHVKYFKTIPHNGLLHFFNLGISINQLSQLFDSKMIFKIYFDRFSTSLTVGLRWSIQSMPYKWEGLATYVFSLSSVNLHLLRLMLGIIYLHAFFSHSLMI